MSSSDIEKIKEKINIVDLISSYIKVDKAGINYKARCPFHNEKTPSFFISEERQSFYCFGCGEKGDIFSFVEKFESTDFKGALELLASRAGVELVKSGPKKEKDETGELFEIMEKATKFYENNLSKNKEALEYLKNRGLSESSISKWRIGLAKNEWRDLHDELLSSKFSKKVMLEAGLIKKVPDADKHYDTFRGRVMFPIFDPSGKVIAFSGRILHDDGKSPKYLNSPETKLFKKSEVLYGFNFAKNQIRKSDYAILVEGQMDLVMSHQSGVTNTVASSGTALTEEHLKKIKRLTNKIVIAYDGDKAGENAAKRAAEIALSLEMETKIAPIKENEDPASIIKEDKQEWIESIKKSMHFADFVLEKISKSQKGERLIKEIKTTLFPVLSLIKSDMEKSRIINKISKITGASESSVWNDFEKNKTGFSERQSEVAKSSGPPTLEEMAVAIVFSEETSGESETRKKLEEILGKEKTNLLIESKREYKEKMTFEIERQNMTKERLESTKKDILKRLELHILKKKLKEKSLLLDNKNLNKEDEVAISKEINELQKQISNLRD